MAYDVGGNAGGGIGESPVDIFLWYELYHRETCNTRFGGNASDEVGDLVISEAAG